MENRKRIEGIDTSIRIICAFALFLAAACDGGSGKTPPLYKKARFEIAVVSKLDQSIQNVYSLPFGKKVKIPGADLTLLITEFLPSFSYSEKERTIVLRSDKPDNPAAYLSCFVGGALKYRQWIFQKYPNFGNDNKLPIAFVLRKIDLPDTGARK